MQQEVDQQGEGRGGRVESDQEPAGRQRAGDLEIRHSKRLVRYLMGNTVRDEMKRDHAPVWGGRGKAGRKWGQTR